MSYKSRIIACVMFFCFYSCKTNQKPHLSNTEITNQKKITLEQFGLPKNIIPYEEWIYLKPAIKNWKLKYGSYSCGSTDFNIGIFDKNENNNFLDYGEDIIFVGSGKDTIFAYTPSFSSSAAILEDKLIFNYNEEQFFKISCDQPNELLVERIENKVKNADLILYDQIPDIELKSLLNNLETVDLRGIKNDKPIKFIFWAPWCQPCLQEMEDIMENKEYESLNIISLFAGEDVKKAEAFVRGKNYPWLFLQSTTKLNRAFSQNGLPFFIGFDENGNLTN